MSLLPAGYKRLEYIQSSAEGTYINLNIAPSANNLKIIADAQPTVASSANNVLWQINATYQDAGRTLQFGLFSSNWQLHMPGVFATGTTAASTVRRRIAMTAIGTNWELSGVAGSGSNTYVNTGAWRNNVITVARGNHKHYGYEIYFAGKLQRLLIPAKNASGTIGMYDAITGTFYANVGSGSYTAGPEIADTDVTFKQVEYIQSSGTQYVDTGVVPNQDTRIICDFQLNSANIDGNNLLGSRQTTSAKAFTFSTVSGKWRFGYNNSSAQTSINADANRHTVDMNKNVCYLDGLAIDTREKVSFTGYTSICIGVILASSVYAGYGKFYSFDIYANDSLVRKYIPHVTALDTPGLLDALNNVFYASVSATDFAAGPEVVKEWKLVEWVQSTGVQYVDVLFKPNQLTRMVAEVQPASADAMAISAVDAGWLNNGFGVYTNTSEFGTSNYGISASAERRVFELNKGQLSVGGKALTTMAGTFQSAYNLVIFALNRSGTTQEYFSGKLYRYALYDNGVLLYGLKPCRLLDGRVGLVDESSGVFFASATATALIAGPDLITVPLAPEGLVANVSSGVLTLSWTASENAEGYDVYRNGEYVATTFDTTFTDTINPAIAYEYGVTAYNEHGESEATTVAVPATQRPEQVTDLRAIDAGFNYITLTWDNVAGADAYRVYRNGLLLSEQKETGYSDSGLKTETAYTYGVSAVNEVGESPVLEITVFTTEFKLVTDRTAADVQRALDFSKALPTENMEEWLAGMKGSYNVFDLNRVELAVLYVIERLRIAGWYITVESKTDWKFSDFPTVAEMTRYLNNIRKLRLALPAGLPSVPDDMNAFTYSEANDIERLLEMLDAAVTNIMANVFYSNELYSGEVQ